MSVRDVSAIFDGAACRLCPAEHAPGDDQLEHAALHLAECTAIVVCRGGVERVMPNGSGDPEVDGLTDDVDETVARAAVAEEFARKHRGVRLPRGFRRFRP